MQDCRIINAFKIIDELIVVKPKIFVAWICGAKDCFVLLRNTAVDIWID